MPSVSVTDPLKAIDLGEALAERRGDAGVAPDRQQRVRQPPQRRAEMDIAGEHDVRGAQPRRRRDDALADAGGIDADDRRVLEDPRAGPPRQRRKAMDIFPAVDLERLGIIDAVEIAIGLELAAHAIDLPAFDLGLEILGQHLQPADQLVADIDIGDFERALAQGDARHCSSVALARTYSAPSFDSVPQLARVLEADALDQFADRKRQSPA